MIYDSLAMNLLTIKEASEKLNVGVQRVHQLIKQGTLKAQKVGSYYVIEENQLINIRTYGKAGRPKKKDRDNGQTTGIEKPFKTIFDVVPELAGKHDNLPVDLSTNKKYLEGLGRG